VALAADVVAVLLFAATGRSSHSEGLAPAGVLTTAWPFLAGVGLGWLLVRVWRGRWPEPSRTTVRETVADGVVVWVAAVVGGMLLRRATGSGTDPAFVVVATVVVGTLLVGWRLVWQRGWSVLRRRWRPTWGRRSSARPDGARGRSSRPT
jgi:hypothetical protein